MTTEPKQPTPPNPFINAGRPAFAKGGDKAKKIWAIVTTIGFGIFWFSALFLAAGFFGARDMTIWPMVMTPISLAIGILGRVMMVRENA